MRVLALVALVVAAPAAAQDARSDSAAVPLFPPAGPYVEGGAGVGWGGSSGGLIVGGQAAIGYQLPNGFDVAARTFGVAFGDGRGSLALQPDVGYTRALGENAALAARLGVRATMTASPNYRDAGLRFRSVAGVGHVAVSRGIDLGRGLRLVPSAGVYGGVGEVFNTEFDVLDADLDGNGTVAEAGVVVGLQLEFKAFGARFQVGPVVGLPVLRSGPTPPGSYGFAPVPASVRITF